MPSNLTALLIEDNPHDVDLFERVAEKAGVTVKTCQSISDAHDIGGVDVCILDLNLKETNGIETIETFVRAFPMVPVVILSHIDHEPIREACRDRGAHYYLNKADLTANALLTAMQGSVLLRADKLVGTIRQHLEELTAQ